MNTYLETPLKILLFLWQTILLIGVGIVATFDWLKIVFPKLFLFNEFTESAFLFLGAFFFTPMTWWQSLLFILLPMPIAVCVLGLFLCYDLFFLLAHSVVFM